MAEAVLFCFGIKVSLHSKLRSNGFKAVYAKYFKEFEGNESVITDFCFSHYMKENSV